MPNARVGGRFGVDTYTWTVQYDYTHHCNHRQVCFGTFAPHERGCNVKILRKPRKPGNVVSSDGMEIPIPDVAELLRDNPLPPELAEMESVIRHHPQMQDLVALAVACIAHGMTPDETMAAMNTAAEALTTKGHRCVCCLAWADYPRLCGFFDAGRFSMLAFCKQCVRRIDDGTVTRQMQRNLRSYGGAL